MGRKHKLLSILLTVVLVVTSFGFTAVNAEENPIEKVANMYEVPHEELIELSKEVEDIINLAIEVCGDDAYERAYEYLLINGYIALYDLTKEDVIKFCEEFKNVEKSEEVIELTRIYYEKLSVIAKDLSLNSKEELRKNLVDLEEILFEVETLPYLVRSIVEDASVEYGEDVYAYFVDLLNKNKITEAYNITNDEIKEFVKGVKNAKTFDEIRSLVNNSSNTIIIIIKELPNNVETQLRDYAVKYATRTKELFEVADQIEFILALSSYIYGEQAYSIVSNYLQDNAFIKAHNVSSKEIKEFVELLKDTSNVDDIYQLVKKLIDEGYEISGYLPELVEKTYKDIYDGCEWFWDYSLEHGHDINLIKDDMNKILEEVFTISEEKAGPYIWKYLEENGYVSLYEKYMESVPEFANSILCAKSVDEVELCFNTFVNEVLNDLVLRHVLTPQQAKEVINSINSSESTIRTRIVKLCEEVRNCEAEHKSQIESFIKEYETTKKEIEKDIKENYELACKVYDFTSKQVNTLSENVVNATNESYAMISNGYEQTKKTVKSSVDSFIVEAKELTEDAVDKVIDSIENHTEAELMIETAEAIDNANKEFETMVDDKIEVVEEVRNDVISAIVENGQQNGWLEAYLNSEYAR